MMTILKLRTNILVLAQTFVLVFSASTLLAQDSTSIDYDGYDTIVEQLAPDTIISVTRPDHLSTQSWRQNLREVPDSVVDSYKNDPDFAYANDPSFWKKDPPADNSGLIRFIDWISRSALVRWILYLFLAAIILFTLYQVMVVNGFFVLSRKKTKSGEEPEDAGDVSDERLDDLLRNAIDERNYRLATRLLYLKTLKFLAARELIQLHAKNTNNDYLHQMRQKEGSTEFQRLTRIYEYAWYGEYSLNEQQFEYVHQHFNNFITR